MYKNNLWYLVNKEEQTLILLFSESFALSSLTCNGRKSKKRQFVFYFFVNPIFMKPQSKYLMQILLFLLELGKNKTKKKKSLISMNKIWQKSAIF